MTYFMNMGASAIGLAVFIASLTFPPATAQEPTVQRKVLLTHDLAVPGYQVVLGAVEIPPGGREGRHTHPGAVVVYIQEGVLTFDYEGSPTMTYKAGDSFFIEEYKARIPDFANDVSQPVFPRTRIGAFAITHTALLLQR